MQRDANGDLWVFGYGSLMWNPGFSFADAAVADLAGYHRSFCLYSEHYRGTPAHRGLVLGLDLGGHCRGRVFRVPAATAEATLAYLIQREMYGHPIDVYRLEGLAVTVGAAARTAACFVVNREHPHYAGRLSAAAIAERVAAARGISGTNHDYLMQTIAHLEEFGIRDDGLLAVRAALAGRDRAAD
ncbi:MAG: gamma-glutamylcyclotransferase [Alphaproteobacteria bacterium]|nr:gamma-glutamylcyclotransferase [Alphaproteobacteria bacterium]